VASCFCSILIWLFCEKQFACKRNPTSHNLFHFNGKVILCKGNNRTNNVIRTAKSTSSSFTSFIRMSRYPTRIRPIASGYLLLIYFGKQKTTSTPQLHKKLRIHANVTRLPIPNPLVYCSPCPSPSTCGRTYPWILSMGCLLSIKSSKAAVQLA
jgi:hypothetical protein